MQVSNIAALCHADTNAVVNNEVVYEPRASHPRQFSNMLGGLDVGMRRFGIAHNMAMGHDDADCCRRGESLANSVDHAINACLASLRLGKGGQTSSLVQTRYGKAFVFPIIQK